MNVLPRLLSAAAATVAAPLHYTVTLARRHRQYQARMRVVAIKDAYGI